MTSEMLMASTNLSDRSTFFNEDPIKYNFYLILQLITHLLIILFYLFIYSSNNDISNIDRDNFDDNDVNKLIIITQTIVCRPKKRNQTHSTFTRINMTQDIEKNIDLGLRLYEKNLWRINSMVFNTYLKFIFN